MSRRFLLALAFVSLSCSGTTYIDGQTVRFVDASDNSYGKSSIDAGAQSSGGRCDTAYGTNDSDGYSNEIGLDARGYDTIGITLPGEWQLRPPPSHLKQAYANGFTFLKDVQINTGGTHTCNLDGFDACTDTTISAAGRSFVIESTNQQDGEYTHDFRVWGGRLLTSSNLIGPKSQQFIFSYVKTYYVLNGHVTFDRPNVSCNVTSLASYDFGTVAPGASLKSNLPMRVSCNLPTRITMSLTPPRMAI